VVQISIRTPYFDWHRTKSGFRSLFATDFDMASSAAVTDATPMHAYTLLRH